MDIVDFVLAVIASGLGIGFLFALGLQAISWMKRGRPYKYPRIIIDRNVEPLKPKEWDQATGRVYQGNMLETLKRRGTRSMSTTYVTEKGEVHDPEEGS